MSNYTTLKQAIQSVIKTNGNEEITGAVLQSALLSIIDSIGANYTFGGVATPQTDAGSPDQNVFYIALSGTYTNFGSSITVPVGSIGVFSYNGNWQKVTVPTTEVVDGLDSNDANKALSANQGRILNENAENNRKLTTYHQIETGKGWVVSTGQYIDSQSYDATRLCAVIPTYKYRLSILPKYILFFDKDGVYTSTHIDNPTDNTLTIPQNVYYIAMNFTTGSDIPNVMVECINYAEELNSASRASEASYKVAATSGASIPRQITESAIFGQGWVTNAVAGGQVTFRNTTSTSYGYYKIDAGLVATGVIAYDVAALASVQSGFLTIMAFADDNGNVLGVHGVSNSGSAITIPHAVSGVPVGTKYIYVNVRDSNDPDIKVLKYSTSILRGATIYCDGDSVARGAGTGNLHEVPPSEQIAAFYGMTLTNAAVSGTTLGYKDSDPTYTDSIPTRMIANLTGHTYDYILFNGGFNDLSHCQLGTMTPDYTTTPDPTTTLGGLETICKWLMENMPSTKKLFILEHRWTNANQPTYWSAMVQVLKKWGIPYVDIYEGTQLYELNQTLKDNWFYLSDGLHPNTAAYTKFYVNKIAKALEMI